MRAASDEARLLRRGAHARSDFPFNFALGLVQGKIHPESVYASTLSDGSENVFLKPQARRYLEKNRTHKAYAAARRSAGACLDVIASDQRNPELMGEPMLSVKTLRCAALPPARLPYQEGSAAAHPARSPTRRKVYWEYKMDAPRGGVCRREAVIKFAAKEVALRALLARKV